MQFANIINLLVMHIFALSSCATAAIRGASLPLTLAARFLEGGGAVRLDDDAAGHRTGHAEIVPVYTRTGVYLCYIIYCSYI